jgi:hypothetical protein
MEIGDHIQQIFIKEEELEPVKEQMEQPTLILKMNVEQVAQPPRVYVSLRKRHLQQNIIHAEN